MTIYIFGKGDEIYLPKQAPATTTLGGEVAYTHPSYEWCYSSHGFAVPLDYEGVPFDCWLNDTLPPTSDHIGRYPTACDYLLVTHDGRLWKASIAAHQNKKTGELENKISETFIYRSPDSWWTGKGGIDIDMEMQMLLGFLRMNPTSEKIDSFFYQTFKAQEVDCFSISAIVAKLKEEYPKGHFSEKLTEQFPATTKAISQILSDLID